MLSTNLLFFITACKPNKNPPNYLSANSKPKKQQIKCNFRVETKDSIGADKTT